MSVRANHPLASRWLEVATRSPGTQVCIFWGHRPAGLWYWSGVLSEYRIERDPAGGGSILTLLIQGGVKALNDGLSVRSLANPMLGNDR
jgi:hypothetical protein